MEFIIIGLAILIGGLGLVAWFRITDEWHDRDEWRRFQDAMERTDRYTRDEPGRPE